MKHDVLPLGCAGAGRDVVVVEVQERFRARFAELGFFRGRRCRVLQNGGGFVVVAFDGGRLALGYNVAMGIFVYPQG